MEIILLKITYLNRLAIFSRSVTFRCETTQLVMSCMEQDCMTSFTGRVYDFLQHSPRRVAHT